MAEYIERDALLMALGYEESWRKNVLEGSTFDIILKFKAADVAPVRPGNWCWITEDIYRCDNCGEMSHVKEVMGKPDWHYCPNCGAKMELDCDG